MITILKFPVYVQIETGNMDRSRVSSFSKEKLHPLLLQYLASAGIKKTVLDEFSREFGSPVSVTLLTELDLINKWVSNEVPSTYKID
jgi:hypothetical protein